MSDEKPVAAREKPAMENKHPPQRIPDAEMVAERFSLTTHNRLQKWREEITQLLWPRAGQTQEEKQASIAHALELFEGLAPEDSGAEMVAMQMVGTHLAAMECLRRAAQSGQHLASSDKALAQAAKLLALYDKQFRTLQKSRGKGQQKVTVEHVNVEPGGQAIVDNVQTGTSPAPAQANGKPAASSEGPGQAAEKPLDARSAAGIRVRRRGS